MSRFLESIAVKNGKAPLIDFHQKRYENCMQCFYPQAKIFHLSLFLDKAPQDNILYKLRVLYDENSISTTYIPYKKREINEIIAIDGKNISYPWKYANRQMFDELRKGLNDKQEILIFKNGLLTDSSYSNVVLQKGNAFFTPETPLLKGVQREFLLSKNLIKPKSIHRNEVLNYDRIIFINAMMDLEAGINLPIEKVRF